MLTQKWLLLIGTLMGFLSVALGAFAAHALKKTVSTDLLTTFETGARYQMYHAFAICLAAWISGLIPGILPPLAGWFFIFGIVIFSGSLYLLSLTGIRFFGAFTPIGGTFFLLGWLTLSYAIFKTL